jgi:hypothetical protein
VDAPCIGDSRRNASSVSIYYERRMRKKPSGARCIERRGWIARRRF